MRWARFPRTSSRKHRGSRHLAVWPAGWRAAEPLIIVDGTISRASLALRLRGGQRRGADLHQAGSKPRGREAARYPPQRGGVIVLSKRIPNANAHAFKVNPDGSLVRDAGNNRVPEEDGIADNPYPEYHDQQQAPLKARSARSVRSQRPPTRRPGTHTQTASPLSWCYEDQREAGFRRLFVRSRHRSRMRRRWPIRVTGRVATYTTDTSVCVGRTPQLPSCCCSHSV